MGWLRLKKRASADVERRRAKTGAAEAENYAFATRAPNALTLHDRSVALPDNVRDLLDWLIDEELKRWQRETR